MNIHELIYFLVLAVVNSFVIIGWNRASNFEYTTNANGFSALEKQDTIQEDSKMILWKLRYWSIEYLGEFWSKPILTCPTCQSSVHSLYVYWLTQPLTLHSLIVYPFYILLLAGMVTLINSYT